MSYGGVIVARRVYTWNSLQSDGRQDVPLEIARWKLEAERAVAQGQPVPPAPEGFEIRPHGKPLEPELRHLSISFVDEQVALLQVREADGNVTK